MTVTSIVIERIAHPREARNWLRESMTSAKPEDNRLRGGRHG
jgi:hypothetical protein